MSNLFISIGSGPGMGVSTAARFAREGFDLVLASRNISKIQQGAEAIKKETGRSVETFILDARDYTAVQQLADRFGGAAHVVHYNAAAIEANDLFETPMERFESNLKVDIAGGLAAVKFFAPYLEKRGNGTILLTGGGLALAPSAEYLSLTIGKAGIRSMTQALFPQLSARGVHIATLTVSKYVAPGSQDAVAAADAFWKLHSQAQGQWTWESMLE